MAAKRIGSVGTGISPAVVEQQVTDKSTVLAKIKTVKIAAPEPRDERATPKDLIKAQSEAYDLAHAASIRGELAAHLLGGQSRKKRLRTLGKPKSGEIKKPQNRRIDELPSENDDRDRSQQEAHRLAAEFEEYIQENERKQRHGEEALKRSQRQNKQKSADDWGDSWDDWADEDTATDVPVLIQNPKRKK